MSTSSPLFIVLFGAQGSGKGTQARLIQAERGIPQVATGDLFRHNLKNETELGRLAKTYMDKGELVPDSVTNAMVRERLVHEDALLGAILDGYPRNLAQAEALEVILKDKEALVSKAIYIDVPEAELMRRLTGRRVCRSCQATYHIVYSPSTKEGICDRCGGLLYQRADDQDAAAIRRRLDIYFEETTPVIDWYRAQGLLASVDGTQSIRLVQESIALLLK